MIFINCHVLFRNKQDFFSLFLDFFFYILYGIVCFFSFEKPSQILKLTFFRNQIKDVAKIINFVKFFRCYYAKE